MIFDIRQCRPNQNTIKNSKSNFPSTHSTRHKITRNFGHAGHGQLVQIFYFSPMSRFTSLAL